MGSVNKVMLIGRLGKDPELTYTPSGMAVAKFTMATSERKKNQQGEWEETTDWHRIVLFGKTAEAAGQYLTKGGQVYIEGRISYSTFERDGVKQYFTDILCNRMQMLGSRDSGARPEGGGGQYQQNTKQSPPQNNRNMEPQSNDDYEEDLPF